ncbi:MAG: hypothetical protein C0403_05730, partial [Desulfobacterium sp.]|nr:hypothetical protein [Desulfobacterium sp.]
DDSNPPFMYDKDGKASGLYPELTIELFKRIGAAVSVKAYPWKRVVMMIDKSTAGVAGIYKNKERLQKYDYSDPIGKESIHLFVKSDSNISFTKFEDLKGYRIGINVGWSLGDEFDNLKKQALFTVDEGKSTILNFQKMKKNRIDAVACIYEDGLLQIKELGISNEVKSLPKEIITNEVYITFNKNAGKTALLKKINEEIQKMKADGSIQAIYDKILK